MTLPQRGYDGSRHPLSESPQTAIITPNRAPRERAHPIGGWMSPATGKLFRNIAGSVIVLSGTWSLPASGAMAGFTPGIPRTADGKPDLSGRWRVKQTSSGETDKAMHSVKAQPPG